MNRRICVLAMLAGVLVLTGLNYRALAESAAAPASAANDVRVSIDNYVFKAPKITIAPGAAVVWRNADDDPHTVTADDGSFDSKGLGQGDTFRHVFAKPGTYPYHCAVHPFMKGVVIVGASNP